MKNIYITTLLIFGFVMSATAQTNPGNYYQNLDVNDQDFLDDLSTLLSNHTQLDYSNNVVVANNVLSYDTLGGKAVNCEYSNQLITYQGSFSYGNLGCEREHILPKSWMPSNAGNNDIEGADYHNLALTISAANQKRSNRVEGNVTATGGNLWTLLEAKYDNANHIFEPRDEFKGDVARAMFYMVACYDGKGGSWAFDDLDSYGSDQNVAILKQWHDNDPVSDIEREKHAYIAQIQGSRNPFVDNPQWVDCIDFRTLTVMSGCQLDTTHTAGGGMVSVKDLLSSEDILVYPNPTKDILNVKIVANDDIDQLEVLSSTGQLVLVSSQSSLDIGNLTTGIYILKVTTAKGVYVENIQKQ